MKRTLSMIMSVALILTSVPMQGLAEEVIIADSAEMESMQGQSDNNDVTENATEEFIEEEAAEIEDIVMENEDMGQDQTELSGEEPAQTMTELPEDTSEQASAEEAGTDDVANSEEYADDIDIISMDEVGTVPVAASGTGETGEENGFEYTVLEDGTAEITGYSGTEERDLNIPAEVGGCKVSSIGNYAFTGMFENSIVLPESLTSMSASSFALGQTIINESEKLALTDSGQNMSQRMLYHVDLKKIFSTGIIPTGEIEIVGPLYNWIYYVSDYAMKIGEKKQIECSFPERFISILQWGSSDESVATVDSSGLITAVGEGKCQISLSGGSSPIHTREVYVSEYGRNMTEVGDLTWYMPPRVKLGYQYSEWWKYSGDTEWGSNIIYTEVNNLPEGSVDTDHGDYLSIGDDWTRCFSYLNGSGRTCNGRKYNGSAYVRFECDLKDRPYAIYPGTVTFQASIQGADGTEIRKLGDPYVVTIEEPVIETNESESVKIGDSILLSAELKNTLLDNELVPEVPSTSAHDIKFHNLAYQPEFIIEEGADLVELSNGDFSHTLKASEQLKFTGEGTVKIKVKYRQSYRCTCEAASNWNYYEPEKTITIQVYKELPSELKPTPDTDPTPGTSVTPGQKPGTGAASASAAKIKVGKAAISSLKNSKKKAAVLKLKKVSGAKGYEVVYSTNKKFRKDVKTKSTKKLSLTLKKLKRNKTYYVKVRAYKLDSTGTKVYGKYSKVKKVKIRK